MTVIIKNAKGDFVSRMTIAEFARAQNLSEHTIRARIKSGRLEAVKKGKTWLIDPDLLGDIESEANNPLGINGEIQEYPMQQIQNPLMKAKTEKEQAVAKMKQMELEQMRDNLVSSDQVRNDAFKCARVLRDSIMRVPQRIAAEVACETDPHKVEIILDKEIRRALEIIANTDLAEFFEDEVE